MPHTSVVSTDQVQTRSRFTRSQTNAFVTACPSFLDNFRGSVGPAPKLASIISGKIYRFPPNKLYLKSLALMLTENQPSYDIETYVQDTTKPGPKFTGPIGLHGLYRKGELTYQGVDNPFFGGPPRVRVVNAVKGTWVDDHTFVVDWRVLGLANSPEERWILTFDEDKLEVRIKFGAGSEMSVDGETGG
jgi:hypothetical protein